MKDKYDIANDIVNRIVNDLSGRSGYGQWGDEEDPIIKMIKSEWEVIVVKRLYEWEEQCLKELELDEIHKDILW